MKIIGVSGLYHDSAAALVAPGLIKASGEERFTRIKHDNSLPKETLKWLKTYCDSEVDYLVFYERPLLKLDRIQALRKGHLKNWGSYHKALKEWASYKIWVRPKIQELAKEINLNIKNDILFANHHQSHAASAFYMSPFESSGVLCLDGVGEWSSGSIAKGEGDKLTLVQEQIFPNSIGLFYGTMTSLAGFKVNSGEYKLMGLAPYGEAKYVKKLLENVIHVDDQGGVKLNMKYFGFLESEEMYSQELCQLLFKSRTPGLMVENGIPTNLACDIAASAQEICDKALINSSRYALEITKEKNLAVAGGVALNAVSIGKILELGIAREVYVQPAASDSGGALGAALCVGMAEKGYTRSHLITKQDPMNNSFLGYQITNEEVSVILTKYNLPKRREKRTEVNKFIAQKLEEGKIVGVARDEMEFGARALGNRSILADARGVTIQKKLNKAVKKRETFRPFAPAILEEEIESWCEYPYGSEYMTVVAKIKQEKQIQCPKNIQEVNYIKQTIDNKRSEIPGVTHVDYSARTQIVKQTNPLHPILKEFHKLTTIPVIVNTSFNLRGEPIVCTAEDALKCFASSEIDYLILQEYIVTREDIKNKNIPQVTPELD
jgi:carbamoyltransferase